MENTLYGEMLIEEANAFNHQILERVEHGHVPDLRATKRCEWFNNNVWRDPYYANLLYGRIVKQILGHINSHFEGKSIRILEVACGPGHIALELARAGHSVVGIDISGACVNVAKETAMNDPYVDGRGDLDFKVQNVFDLNESESFDMVVFSCALHHFDNQDQIVRKVKSFLKFGGSIFVSEPTKTPLSDSEAELVFIMRSLLSFTGHYHTREEVDRDYQSIDRKILQIRNEYSFIDENGEKTQSPLDNEASRDQMLTALNNHFDELEVGGDFTFFDRIVGGLRMGEVLEEHQIAQWLRLMDDYFLAKGRTQPQQFYFIGRKSL